MSLLMKALEKAAKDRGETQQQPATATTVAAGSAAAGAAASPAMELSLEPLQADTPAPPPQAEPAPPARAAAKSRNDRNQARAATVMQATARAAPAAPVTGGLRIRPVMALGLLAGIVTLGFAVYVYLQITNPGMFIRQPPPAAKPLTPLTQAPAPAPAPIATGTVIAPAEQGATQTRAAEPVQAARGPAAAEAAPARSAETPRNNIQVSPGAAEPQLNPQLGQAYAALQSGKLETARQLYSDAARGDPRNINALLGLAAIAMQDGRPEEASRLYFNVLDLEPRNAYAQTGLIALMGRADPAAAESKLKQLIAREPLASLYFTLGNLYGDQSRWSEAQQAYFQAHQLEPANPDYAYNLAVGLEHIGQPRLAANFYQRAVDQAKTKGRAGFNPAQAQDRIRQLAALPQ